MQNAQLIAREALKELLKSGKEPTPEAYTESYNAQARKLGFTTSEEAYSIDKILAMLDKDVRDNLPNKQFKNKNELLVAFVKLLNQLSFSKRGLSVCLEILKLCLRFITTHPHKEMSMFAKGHLIELDKLNPQSMQIWRERWADRVKRHAEFDFLEFLKGLEILSNFKIPNAEFQKWQDEARSLLKGERPNKVIQIQLLQKLENILKDIAIQKESPVAPMAPNPVNTRIVKEQKIPLCFKNFAALPIDSTTTLVSKEGINEVLNFAEEEFLQRKENYSVIIFGIAAFSKIKENFGAEAAKKVLAILGRLLKQYSNERDLIAYYGDEEFLACLLQRTKEEAINFICNLDKIVTQSKFMFQQMRIEITLSAQVSHRIEAQDLESMLKMSIKEFIEHKDSQGIIRYEK